MAATTVTSKGQVTIPKRIRVKLGIRPGDRVLFLEGADGRVVIEAESVDIRTLRGALRHEGPAVSLEEMDEAVRRGAARSGAR